MPLILCIFEKQDESSGNGGALKFNFKSFKNLNVCNKNRVLNLLKKSLFHFKFFNCKCDENGSQAHHNGHIGTYLL